MQSIAPDTKPSLDVLSPRELREALANVSTTTIWRMRQRGEFPEPIRLSPGRVGYRRVEVEKWLADRTRAR